MNEGVSDNTEFDNQAPWGGVTDPAHHDPLRFRYLIHLDEGSASSLDPKDNITDAAWQYLLDDPEKIKSLAFVPASLVDQDHRVIFQGTISTHGFILEAPERSVLAASPRDMFSNGQSIDVLSAEHPVPAPDQLLAETNPTEWNELAVSPEGLVVKAIFWVENQTGEEPAFDRATCEKMAEKHGLPFLELDLNKY